MLGNNNSCEKKSALSLLLPRQNHFNATEAMAYYTFNHDLCLLTTVNTVFHKKKI